MTDKQKPPKDHIDIAVDLEADADKIPSRLNFDKDGNLIKPKPEKAEK